MNLMIFTLIKYFRQRPQIWRTVVCLLIVDLALSALFQRIIPDHWYLRAYLPWTAVLKTERFLQGEMQIELHPGIGWHNKAAARKLAPGGDFSGREQSLAHKHRLLLLGDSRMNYSNVDSSESLTVYLEQQSLEVINLATEMYGFDQSIMALENALERVQPDLVVISLGTETGDLLDCHYLPFLYPTIGLPLLKPRYLVGDSLQKIPVNSFLEKKALLYNPELMLFLEKNDPHYSRFLWFKTRRSTPFLCLFSLVREWGIEVTRELLPPTQPAEIANRKLTEALILHSRRLSESYSVQLVYLLLPQKEDLHAGHTQIYRQLAGMLEENSIQYLNVFELFNTRVAPEEMFDRDGVHLSAPANALLAQALQEIIREKNSFGAR